MIGPDPRARRGPFDELRREQDVLSPKARAGWPRPEGARVLEVEAPPGRFARSFVLGDEVDRGAVAAELRDGVLRPTLPAARRAPTRRIEVRSPLN